MTTETTTQYIARRKAELIDYYRKHGCWPDLRITEYGPEFAARNEAAREVRK